MGPVLERQHPRRLHQRLVFHAYHLELLKCHHHMVEHLFRVTELKLLLE
jgi:hypothetical protein